MAERPEDRQAFARGLRISGAVHGAILAFVAIGTDWLAPAEPVPFTVTEVSLIDGARFEAQVSAAPAEPAEAPEALSSPAPEEAPPEPAESESAPAPDPAPERPVEEAPEDAPVIAAPPPPTPVPSAEARPSIAEVPTPETLAEQAAEPESPPATEVVQPLASREAPLPGARPERPPDPEPAPEEAEATPEPEPEPEQSEPEPEALAETQPEAPVAASPQTAALPVARPADRAAAARASRETRQAAPEPETGPEPEPEPTETATAEPEAEPEPEAQPAPSAARFARQITRGEKDALRLGLKQYFFYRGRVSDPRLAVRVGITLDRAGRIIEGPELLAEQGGTPSERQILYRDARSALIQAMQAGVFAELPADKHDAWKRIHVTFTPEDIGFSS